MEVGIVGEHRWYKFLRDTAVSFGLWDKFEDFSFSAIREPIDQLLQCVVERERQSILDLVMLGVLHPTYKNLKFVWGREAYLNEGLSLREISFIMKARSDMLPLAFKPWFVQSDHQCVFCNSKANETGEHFFMDCPIWREFRPVSFNSCTFYDILGGKVEWKEVVCFVSRSLRYRKLLEDEFS